MEGLKGVNQGQFVDQFGEGFLVRQNVGRTWTEREQNVRTKNSQFPADVGTQWRNPKSLQIYDNTNGNARLSRSCSVEVWYVVLTCASFVSISAAGRNVLQMSLF